MNFYNESYTLFSSNLMHSYKTMYDDNLISSYFVISYNFYFNIYYEFFSFYSSFY